MDDLTIIEQMHVPEPPPSPQTAAAARRRLLQEAAGARSRRIHRSAPLPRSRRTMVLTAGATACALAVGSWMTYKWETRPLYHPEPLAGQSGPASTFLLTAADAKTRHASDGRLWYVHRVVGETVVAASPYRPGVHYTVQTTLDDYSVTAKSAKDFGVHLPYSNKDSAGVGWNGGEVAVRPVSPADMAAWKADFQPGAQDLSLQQPDEERGPFRGEGAELDFDNADALSLPADPSKLRAWILNYATKFDHRRLNDPDLYLFTGAPIFLVDRVVSDRVRIATYRMLAGLKGVRMITGTDADGRTGKGVAMRQTTGDYGTIEWQLLIDPETGRLTASQGIVVTPGRKNAGLRPGTREFFEIVKKAEWTNAPTKSLVPKSVTDPILEPPTGD
ncbi:hypothetical protein [Actinomadura violacea]|uniref:Uncharacterized protein n=1 Tax=Actinomadura violacea TaxID=2819934 RepID=A0ABS3RQG8_9ACTN|nr:hypothetical protein [Actinomadura violacea]MBO2458304.1 hypothetical protein [Actinomadura violacea]